MKLRSYYYRIAFGLLMTNLLYSKPQPNSENRLGFGFLDFVE